MLSRLIRKCRNQGWNTFCRFHASMASTVADARVWVNPAAVLYGVNDLRFEDFPLSGALRPGQVRVEMKSAGICGSDVHFLKKGRIGDYVLEGPMIIGHESSGQVVEVASDVTNVRPGDRVALEPGVPCWSHPLARKGRYNLDPEVRFFATPPCHGSLAQFVDHPADFCYRLPAEMSFDEGALAEPLSVGIHAVKRAKIHPGKTVAILGAGPIGLLTLMCAKAFGADAVAVTDLKDHNLDVADALGADVTFMPRPGMTPDDIALQLRHMVQNRGMDVIIDCAGYQDTIQTALKACSSGGRVVLVGLGQTHVHLDVQPAVMREVDIMGSFRYANTYPLAIKLMQNKRVDVNKIITHRLGFSAQEVAMGFDIAARAHETGAIKVMFDMT